MEPPVLPAVSDPERLAALRRTGLLDGPRDEALDRITRLARLVLDAPSSVITLVDEDRQFFASESGHDTDERETPLPYSFCQYVVATGRPLTAGDARETEVLRRKSRRRPGHDRVRRRAARGRRPGARHGLRLRHEAALLDGRGARRARGITASGETTLVESGRVRATTSAAGTTFRIVLARAS